MTCRGGNGGRGVPVLFSCLPTGRLMSGPFTATASRTCRRRG
jgi:hypothetical protein